MRYPQELKSSIVARLLKNELSFKEAERRYDVNYTTLKYWVNAAKKKQATGVQADHMDKLNLPNGVTYLQTHGAVMAKKLLSETDFGQYCRKNLKHGLRLVV